MLATAALATTPGNHASPVNANAVPLESSASMRVVCTDDTPEAFDGGSGPVVDGVTRP